MKKLFIIFSYVLFVSQFANAEISSLPAHTFFVNDIETVNVVDSFMVCKTSKTISSYKFNKDINKFEYLNSLYLNINGEKTKRFDSILIYEDLNKDLYFINVGYLPEIIDMGKISFNFSFHDYVIDGNWLYLSAYYDGILRYDITDLTVPKFVDSSMTGILVTQLEKKGDYLYALDEYNGILRYDISGESFGDFVDYLYVPLRAKAFSAHDSVVCITLTDNKIYLGDFNQIGSGVIDSFDIDFTPLVTTMTDSLFLFLTNRKMQAVNRFNYNERNLFDIEYNGLAGDLFYSDSLLYLTLPDFRNGVTLFDTKNGMDVSQGLAHAGFNDYALYNNKLFTSSYDLPVEVFDLTDSSEVVFSNYIFGMFDSVSALDIAADSLFVAYPKFREVAIIEDANLDSYFLENSFYTGEDEIEDIKYVSGKIRGVNLILLKRLNDIAVHYVNDSGEVKYGGQWLFADDFQTMVFKDTLLMTYQDNLVNFYTIDSSLFLSWFKTFSIKSDISTIALNGDYLYLFTNNAVEILDINDIDFVFNYGSVASPIRVVDAVAYNDNLYAVGVDGFEIIDVSNVISPIVDFGGKGGTEIQADNNIVAVSDGHSVMIYYIDGNQNSNPVGGNDEDVNIQASISQNYPNPFNLETVISYKLPKDADVKLVVYNILGQNVKTLVDEYQDAGVYSVSWDGFSEGGTEVASGVYFYKITVGDISEIKKMVLLK